MNPMVERTKLARAHSKFTGLKTAVPWSLVKEWNLEAGEFLLWEWKVIDNQMVMTLKRECKKAESQKDPSSLTMP